MRSFIALGLVAALSTTAPTARAQIDYFGQNKVHYHDFQWRVLQGAHVDLYFYPEEEELARVALAYAESSFRDLERRFGHTPEARIPLVVYASHTHFEQTNLLAFVPPEGLLGVTEFLRRRVAVPFNGSYAQFRHTLRHELVHAFQLSVVAGTYRRHPRNRHVAIPLWWTEGLAEFWSGGEDSRDEMLLRELTISGRLPSLEQLRFVTSALVYPLGGSIVRWLADRFGDWRVQLFYRDLWRYASFDDALTAVYGVAVDELDNELRYHFRRKYYPAVTNRQPLDVAAERLAEGAIRPVAYHAPGDSATHFLFLSPNSGYVTIYSGAWRHPDRHQVVLRGERSAEFESLHPIASRLDVRDGVAVFSSKFQERDAIFFWDLERGRVMSRFQFAELVGIRSPSWVPDGESVVLSGLTASGFSDLYRMWLPDGRLERLTSDRYEDLDPTVSPDGHHLVFSSDRTPFGVHGARNLFLMDLSSGSLRPLTYGRWRDESPRWAENDRVYFTSDRAGVSDVYSIDAEGYGQRETHTLTGAFDPQWVAAENALLFTGFSGSTFHVFRTPLSAPTVPGDFIAPADTVSAGWAWPELGDSIYAAAEPVPYERRLRLDVVAGDALVAPGLGTAQGAVLLFSDLLADHLLLMSVTTFQGEGLGGLLANFNGQAFYLNQKRRLNWGLGAFRLRGRFFEGDFDEIFEETAFGGFGVVRWPFSRFERVEGQIRIERSDRFDQLDGDQRAERRVGWLVSNYASYVHDNTLWLPTGPIDGSRSNLTVGVTHDVTNGRFDAWSLSLDHRRYFRVAQRAAYAVRAFGYYTGGERPRRISIGGTWGLRGYPRFGRVTGSRAFLLNQELRFPFADFLAIGFPFGELRFPSVQGAVFVDVGGAWTDASVDRGVLGSAGLGLRMPIGFPLVLRLDVGWRFALGETLGYGLSSSADGRFVDFFFGFNY